MKSGAWGITYNSQSVAFFRTPNKWAEDVMYSNTSVINRYSEKYYLFSVNKGLGSIISHQGSSTALCTAQTNPSKVIDIHTLN